MARRSGKINNIDAHQIWFLYDIKVFFVRHKIFFNQYIIYLYITWSFFVNIYSFSVQH